MRFSAKKYFSILSRGKAVYQWHDCFVYFLKWLVRASGEGPWYVRFIQKLKIVIELER
jgi:hypothetical protein